MIKNTRSNEGLLGPKKKKTLPKRPIFFFSFFFLVNLMDCLFKIFSTL